MPWELRVLQHRLGRLGNQETEPWAPAIDVYETHSAFIVSAEVPGLARDQIDLVFEDRYLTIRGRRSERIPSTDIVHFHQVERGHGSFARRFEFTDSIAVDQVSADLADGVLTITLPKAPPSPGLRIQVLST
ncbi:MAG: Hsp20/alpha crystallin family protein [Vicinamibacterales bacterium]